MNLNQLDDLLSTFVTDLGATIAADTGSATGSACAAHSPRPVR
jgi:hypothetical protein